ncbi:hypothetical protein LV83_01985 [Algoriphagus yeomjeoni]|uniref:Uncharacterized protein n=1 Tax=Algoriphagus yeomjeoni TaxID=291403 RepID=A0A327PE80_9BACT|nr:hypothetical protein LV83_01985 [Algoriphagus yeomjeoni]
MSPNSILYLNHFDNDYIRISVFLRILALLLIEFPFFSKNYNGLFG